MNSSPSGIAVTPQPEPDAPARWFSTAAERRTFGRVAIVVALVCCVLPVWVLVLVLRGWDRVAQSNTPLWVGLLTLACYAAPAVAFLCVGRSLLSGRARFARIGGAVLVGAFVTFVTLFAVFD
jgi:hypothetical protein